MSAQGALPIEVTARLVGSYVWTERRLFAILGAFAATEPVPRAAMFFDAWSAGHAEHAERFAGQLPRLAHLEPAVLTVAPGPAQEEALARWAGAPDPLVRLGGLVRVVLPRLIVGYQAHLARTAPVADINLARALEAVVLDETHARAEGETLFGELATGAAEGIAPTLERLQGIEAPLVPVEPGFVAWPVNHAPN